MRTILLSAVLFTMTATPAFAGGGFLDRIAARQGRRQGIREAARVNAFNANVYVPVRAVRVPAYRQAFVAPVYQQRLRVQSFAAPVYGYGFQSLRVQSLGGCGY